MAEITDLNTPMDLTTPIELFRQKYPQMCEAFKTSFREQMALIAKKMLDY